MKNMEQFDQPQETLKEKIERKAQLILDLEKRLGELRKELSELEKQNAPELDK